MKAVGRYAAGAGRGPFTGVRVGLTAVKAWAEVYGKKIAAVSRVESIAAEASGETYYVAAFVNARRDQVFGAFYQRNGSGLARLGDEMVIAPGKFLEAAEAAAKGERISWVSTDAECVIGQEACKTRQRPGNHPEHPTTTLHPLPPTPRTPPPTATPLS